MFALQMSETNQTPTLLASLSRNPTDFADAVKPLPLKPMEAECSTSGSESEAICRWCEYAASVSRARARRGARGRRVRQEHMADAIAGVDAAAPQPAQHRLCCANCAAMEGAVKQPNAEMRRAEAVQGSGDSCFAWLATLMFDSESRARMSSILSLDSCA